jgi:uncharacterized protein (DUF885 family)
MVAQTAATKHAKTADRSNDDFRARFARLAENPDQLPPDERLRALFDLAWERTMTWSPEFATHVGYAAGDHGAWSDMSLTAIDDRRAQTGDPLPVLDAIDPESLSAGDRLNQELFRKEVEDAVDGARFPDHLMAVDQMNGLQLSATRMLAMMPTRNEPDYENILSRLFGLPLLIDQTVALLEQGLADGWTQPRATLREVPDQIASLIVDDPMSSPLLHPFKTFPGGVSLADRERLRADAIDAYSSQVAPALRRLHDYIVNAYTPGARESIAATALPDGEAWYDYSVRIRTTTDLSPSEIHEIGLREVKRIRDAMEEVMTESGFEGDFAAFAKFLRTDRRFFYERAEDLLAGYRDITKRADAELPRLFKILPRLPYGVIAVPDYADGSQPAAYYLPGSLEVGRPGYFYANTFALDERPKWEMEALALHEAVPGHHLQIAITQELEALPEFRRHGGFTAYIEGWGLYSESLGAEMGFYRDPYSQFGRLSFEMWRAIRLVVDTGMHALGWSREQAIDFFEQSSGHTGHDVKVEVDRYVVWPGQALAYKIGELRIKELRAEAERALDSSFDVRAFHDVVLGEGSLPLDILDRRVHAWIDSLQ